MDSLQQEVRQSLAAIENSTKQMKRSISSRYTAPLLILWGVIWILGFLGTFFHMKGAGWIWLVLDIFGVGGTFYIIRRQMKKGDPVKVSPHSKTTRHLFFFWLLLFAYGYLWLNFFAPLNGLQMNAFLCTLVMFAYIIMGMWLEEKCLIWLGIVNYNNNCDGRLAHRAGLVLYMDGYSRRWTNARYRIIHSICLE